MADNRLPDRALADLALENAYAELDSLAEILVRLREPDPMPPTLREKFRAVHAQLAAAEQALHLA